MLLPEEPMPIGVIPGLHSRERKRNNLAVQQRHDPANRPNEARAMRAGPIHRARPGNFLNYLRQNLGENFHRGPADHHLLRREIFALRRINDAQLRNRNSLLLRKTHRRACRLADLVIRHGLRRPGNFARHIFLTHAHAARNRHQSSRRTESFNGTLSGLFHPAVHAQEMLLK